MSATKNVLILIAMDEEAKPFVEHHKLLKVNIDVNVPSVAYQGLINDVTVTVVVNGNDPCSGVSNVGTVPASISALVAINQFKPDLIINAGTAGGFKRVGGAIGDAYISTACKNHDRRIGIPGFCEYGIGNYISHPTKNLVESLGLKSGIVSTGNSLDCTEKDLEMIIANDASVKEMEAASIAWVAEFNKVPFFALKVITDIVDGGRPTHEEFMANLGTAAVKLQEKLLLVVEFVAGRLLSEL